MTTPVEAPVSEPVVTPPTPVETPKAGKTFTADDIERARQQEKDKVYGRVDELQQRLAAIEAEREEARQAEANRVAAEAEASRLRDEDQLSAKELLAKRDEEWAQRFADLEAQREMDRLLLEKDRAAAELLAYQERQLADAREGILPELWEDVSGSTPAEIDASIARLTAKSEAILGNVQSAFDSQRRNTRTVSPFTGPTSGPLEANLAEQELTAEQIANIPLSEWPAWKAKNGARYGMSAQPSDRGLFG